MNTKSKIIVCYHKKSRIYENEVLLPIHDGKDCSTLSINGIIGDNVGENISAKNPYYSELTGLYWLWKNVDAENYGLFHYRRFLDVKNKYNKKDFIYPSLIDTNDWNRNIIDYEMELYDIILPKKMVFDHSLYDFYKKYHEINDLDAVINIIKQDYPQYANACDKTLKSNEGHFCNMFIMKKNIFNEYCSWLFDILQKVETKIEYKKRDPYQTRVFGFLAERMLNIFIQYLIDSNPNLKIKMVNTLFIREEPIKKISFGIGEYLRFSNLIFFKFANIKFTHRIKGEKKK